ncbi:DUF4124 domain-containing protein [Marinobacter pelagius]|uniref:DUF4124 domain-containing protein n=1 Tax=Marinobacter pelagius TaxID=379482 RepID=A0A1I4Z5M9_9GAMM|nr:DUF4124 domain-containing protein [Marinobacter pelagius]SFN45508.1 protein of unknown function [Marinobacter pelagius]
MNRKILMLTLLMALVPGIAHSGSVYKWTDENGVTHFGDRQPTGSKAEQVSVRSGKGSTNASNRTSPQEQVQAMEQEAEKRELTERERAEMEAIRKQREANCATAQSNLRIIDSNARIQVEEDGERRYLSPEEIAEQRMRFEEIAEENCGPMEE